MEKSGFNGIHTYIYLDISIKDKLHCEPGSTDLMPECQRHTKSLGVKGE